MVSIFVAFLSIPSITRPKQKAKLLPQHCSNVTKPSRVLFDVAVVFLPSLPFEAGRREPHRKNPGLAAKKQSKQIVAMAAEAELQVVVHSPALSDGVSAAPNGTISKDED